LAEEKNINAANIDQALTQNNNAEIQNLLGVKGQIGEQLGLDSKWAYRAIKAVGNYGEVYNRHFGIYSKVGIERGINQPWTQGGILYAPIFK
jgi:general L-amino acid transport system substrate-binding protein